MSATTVGQAVTTRDDTAKALTIANGYESRFAAVLPDHIDSKQFLGLAAGALYRDPKVMEAANNAPGAFLNALMRCAALGHQPGTEEFYLVPRKPRKDARPEIMGIEGYRGIIERMYRSGATASVIVREVCENDKFEFVEGVHDRPVHEIDWFGSGVGRGEMIGVYAYAVLVTGAVSRVVVLSRSDIEAVRAKSDSAKSEYSPWNRDERAMWWKTAARRLEPWVPTSAEYRREQLRAAVEADGLRRALASSEPTTPTVDHPADGDVDQVHDAEIVEEPTAGPSGPKMTQAQQKKMQAQFVELNVTTHDGRVAYTFDVVGREIASTSDLTRDEASKVIEAQVAELDKASTPAGAPAGEPPPDPWGN